MIQATVSFQSCFCWLYRASLYRNLRFIKVRKKWWVLGWANSVFLFHWHRTLVSGMLTSRVILACNLPVARITWKEGMSFISLYWYSVTRIQVVLSELWCAQLLQLCLTLCSPIDCRPPACSIHGVFQARILEWDAMPSARASSWPRDQTCISCVSCISGRFFTTEPPEKAHRWSLMSVQCINARSSDDLSPHCPYWMR